MNHTNRPPLPDWLRLLLLIAGLFFARYVLGGQSFDPIEVCPIKECNCRVTPDRCIPACATQGHELADCCRELCWEKIRKEADSRIKDARPAYVTPEITCAPKTQGVKDASGGPDDKSKQRPATDDLVTKAGPPSSKKSPAGGMVLPGPARGRTLGPFIADVIKNGKLPCEVLAYDEKEMLLTVRFPRQFVYSPIAIKLTMGVEWPPGAVLVPGEGEFVGTSKGSLVKVTYHWRDKLQSAWVAVKEGPITIVITQDKR